jgi:MoaA/NifB/PqqE/SkfB family radical SAM enzyme
VQRIANRLGTRRFLVTNLLPYSAEMSEELLYSRALNEEMYSSFSSRPTMELPKVDIKRMPPEVLHEAMLSNQPLSIAGASLGEGNNRCPFVEKGAVCIRWDGAVAPCIPLLYDQTTYLYGFERKLQHRAFGNVSRQNLWELWSHPEYVAFRERVRRFDFSPCTFCAGCELLQSNNEDCFGSPSPVCGACLWAQGVIQCP